MRLLVFGTMMIGGAVWFLLSACSSPSYEEKTPTGIVNLWTKCTLQGDRVYWNYGSDGSIGLAVVPHSDAQDCPVLAGTPPVVEPRPGER